MRIEKIEIHSVEKLFENIRKVSLKQESESQSTKDFPYANAEIELRIFEADELSPAQHYVLGPQITKILELYGELLLNDYTRLYKLNGYRTLYIEGCNPIDLLPPLVELSSEDDGSVHNLICDGMHRIYLARMMKTPVQCIFIRNIPKEFPYYALPNSDGWDNIKTLKFLPDNYVKKIYRVPDIDPHSLYRDFNSAFNNVGAPRPTVPVSPVLV